MPLSAGIGLKAEHYQAVLESRPSIGWFEIHPENFMSAGGGSHAYLSAIAANYPLSFHAVGLSLGSAAPLDPEQVGRLRRLVSHYRPVLLSDHLSWSMAEGVHLNDLLPLPYTEEALEVVCANVAQAQELLGRRLLIENPSAYLSFAHSTIPEVEFLNALAQRTGCGILLDVNNLHVSAANLGFDAVDYLDSIDADRVMEIHLAGHSRDQATGRQVLIDDHGSPVCPEVWDLYRAAVRRIGRRPTLVEWDSRVPELPVLLREARQADLLAVDEERDDADICALAG